MPCILLRGITNFLESVTIMQNAARTRLACFVPLTGSRPSPGRKGAQWPGPPRRRGWQESDRAGWPGATHACPLAWGLQVLKGCSFGDEDGLPESGQQDRIPQGRSPETGRLSLSYHCKALASANGMIFKYCPIDLKPGMSVT